MDTSGAAQVSFAVYTVGAALIIGSTKHIRVWEPGPRLTGRGHSRPGHLLGPRGRAEAHVALAEWSTASTGGEPMGRTTRQRIGEWLRGFPVWARVLAVVVLPAVVGVPVLAPLWTLVGDQT